MKKLFLILLSLTFLCFSGLINPGIAQVNLQIPSTDVAPVIDGTIDAVWGTSQSNVLNNMLIGNSTSTSDFSAYFKTLWDASSLYVLAVVTDDSKINDSGGTIYLDDAVEVYLDINNDKLTSYGSTDYQYSFRWNDLTIYASYGSTEGVEFKISGTSTGYILEVKFPWTTLKLASPHSGVLLGFDLHVHDDDDGGERDNKLAWYTTTDFSWQNPSLFATASLVGEVMISYPADKPKISAAKGFYQNPFDATISSVIPDMDIYYTLDGSDPATSPTKIKVPSPAVVRIDPKSTQNRGKTPGVVLRARAKKDGYDFSPPVTRTYLFVDEVKNQTSYPGHDWPSTDVNGQQIDLLMDTKVLNDNRYKNLIDDALTEIPSISVTTDNGNLFNAANGIYVNAFGHGLDWEIPASVELINPDGSDGFQIDAGLRIRGGWSRNPFFRKHAFRLFFRKEYGEGKLNFPLFEKEGVSKFDKVDLRCAQNYSWSKGDNDVNWGESPRCTFTRDVFSRDVQGAMNDPYTRSRSYHLYLNGLYWGLYQTQERSEASFASSYFGGSDSDYDVIKQGPGGIESTDGDLLMTAWRAVWDLCQLGFSTGNTNYYKIQGLDATGKRDPTLKVMVDIDNLIDYMNIIFYTGNFDAPFSSFTGGPNNFYIICNRNDINEGFKFFAHDNEHTLLVDPINTWASGNGVNQNRVNLGSTYVMNVSNFEQFQPQWLHYRLSMNAEYRMRFADRAYKLYYNTGILTPAKTAELFRKRTLEIDTAVIAESARWGDVNGGFYTKDDSWVPMVNKTLNEWFPVRTNIVINQLKDEGLLPAAVAPVFKKNNILIEDNQIVFSPGNTLSIVNQNGSGSIKYTVDGKDPRLTGGGVSSTAVDGANLANISILQTTMVNARIFSNGNWSPLHTLRVIVDAQINGLQLTEIHYNPLGGNGLSGNEYEFIELKNRGTADLYLTASTFTDGIKYSFNSKTVINPGKFIVLASSAYSFNQRYGFSPTGEYDGQLDNNGERITLVGAAGDTLISVKYNDKSPWPATPDSLGFSLVPAVSGLSADWDDGNNWRASSAIGGSPNADDPDLNILPVWVNEVLTNSDPPAVDVIELYNPNDVQVNIGGWYLTDNQKLPKNWKIPISTTIPAKGYKTFNEGHYVNTMLNSNNNEFGSAFSLSSYGEEIYIFSANSTDDLTGYEHGFDFGAIETGVSFGLYITSTGNEHFVAQTQLTLNQANSYPRVGPVVIKQIMYHPAPDNFEYIELVNTSSGDVKLFDETNFTHWKFSGIGFDFPPNITLAAGESVYLVESAISPEDFRSLNYLDDEIRIYNYSGNLKNNGEEITLFKALPQDEKSETPYERIDKVEYNNNSEWPDADGNGNALLRKSLTVYGNDRDSWIIAPQSISINTLALNDGIEGFSYSKQLSASGGIPPYSWSTTSGNLPTGLSIDPVKGIIEGIPTQAGTFNVTVKVEDQSGTSDEVSLSLKIKVNTLPVALNDTITTSQNYSAIANVINNDTDLDGDKGSWILSVVSGPANGTVTINNDHTITYTPTKDFYGSDELTYRVTDYKGSSQARLIITVNKEFVIAKVDVRISQSSDDAEENIDSYVLYLASTDLEMTYDVGQSFNQIVGIRFQNIEIPQGATITNATIQFQTDEITNSATSLIFQGEANDNPVTFSSTDLISTRTKTIAQVSWQPESWDIAHEVSTKQKTPDLKDIVQEIVDRAGWNQGNALAMIITGTGTRIAVSYDDATFGITGAALLHIEFEQSGGPAVIPVANAGVNQTVSKGSAVQLNGSLSSSSDGRKLNYHWTIASKPAGSNTVISNTSIVNPTIVPDLFGAYEITLMVDNGVYDSPLSSVTIMVENQQPIASAGSNQTVITGHQVTLDGSSSYDPDGEQLTFQWSFVTKPAGSSASLKNSNSVSPFFTPDLKGLYSIKLQVSDGTFTDDDMVQINVILPNAVIADNITNSLKVYPNPFIDKLVVEYNSPVNQMVTFSLYNISGRLVKTFEFYSLGNHTQVLNLEDENLIYGMYLLVMKSENGIPKVVKVNYQGR